VKNPDRSNDRCFRFERPLRVKRTTTAMSFQSAIPWRVALRQSLPPLYRPVTILNNPLCRTIIFQRTATTPLTSCLSPRVHSKKNGGNPYFETVFAATLPRPTFTRELRKITGPNCPIGPVWPAKLHENRSTSDKSELVTLTPLISARLNLRHRVFRACLITKALTLK
jgi:hypothetical protein